MNKYLLVISFLSLALVGFSQTLSDDFTDARIYINPGHGGHDADDRYIEQTGFWESEGNLKKGLYLYELLDSMNATLMISRTTNFTEDDLPLSVISDQSNSFNADVFISIHSNAFNSKVNYPLPIYNGHTGDPDVEGSDAFATLVGNEQYLNGIAWSKSNANAVGDLTLNPGWTNGYGVLADNNAVSIISEGSFHDYLAESFRLTNDQYCHHEAWSFYRALETWFEVAPISMGVVSGVVKDSLDSPWFYGISNTVDEYLPLSNGRVTLLPENRVYQVDTNQNGVFFFDSLAPGNYQLVFEDFYKEYLGDTQWFYSDTIAVEVFADSSTIVKQCMQIDTTIVPEILSFLPEVDEGDSILLNQEFNLQFSFQMNTESVENAISFDPPVALNFTWLDNNRALLFEPKEKFLMTTTYNFKLDTSAVSHWGIPIADSILQEFVTITRTLLSMEVLYPQNEQVNVVQKPTFRLLFDGIVNEDTLLNHIYLADSENNNISFENIGIVEENGESMVMFEPELILQSGSTYSFIIDSLMQDDWGYFLNGTTRLDFYVDTATLILGSVFEPYDNIASYWAPTGSGSTVGVDPDNTYASTNSIIKMSGNSLELNYLFTDESGGVCRLYNTEKPKIVDNAEATMGIWVHGDMSNNFLEWWFYATGNEIVRVDTINWSGWKYVMLPVEEIPGNSSIEFHSLVIVQNPEGEKQGVNYFDNAQYHAPLHGVSFDSDTVEVKLGSTLTLVPDFNPAEASNTNASWISDNENVVMVSNDGTLTPIAIGNATITITTEEGGYTASIIAKVVDGIGIAENSQLFEIYPNPAKNEISLKGIKPGYKLSVHSALGVLIKTEVADAELSILNIENFENGMYILQIETESEVLNIKFIKE